MLEQAYVREKLIQKTRSMRQKNIAKELNMPVEIISRFMNGRRDLNDESLQALNDYLDNN